MKTNIAGLQKAGRLSSRYYCHMVRSEQMIQVFHQIPYQIYAGFPAWVPPIEAQVEAVFNPEWNTFFTHGQAERWVLWDDVQGRYVGRVAAFINEKRAFTFPQPTGGMGFFECPEDSDAARVLFEQCRRWLQDRGMEAMDGPINFGENDRFWGLLIENYEDRPVYLSNYHPPYYKHLFREYGFQAYFDQLSFKRPVSEPLQELFVKRAQRLELHSGLQVKSVPPKHLEKIVPDFLNVYNTAWKTHDNFKPMSEAQARAMVEKIKPIADQELIWFVYHVNKVVGLLILLPDINEQLGFVKGKMGLKEKITFALMRLLKPSRQAFGLVFGVIPEYQNKGVEGLMFQALSTASRKSGRYKDFIISWIGDFNPRMIRLVKALGAEPYRKHTTFRFLFDRDRTFERSPICK
ncbi:MAG: hypothetical protein J0L99_03440 [Chitinophagales bacterium]|nr:hypothetical protein [Chitinophagales bacterium]